MHVQIKLYVKPDGSVEMVHQPNAEGMLLPERTRSIRRLMNVEWSDKDQLWQAVTIQQRVLFSAVTREQCLALEAQYAMRLLRQYFQQHRGQSFQCQHCGWDLQNKVLALCPHCSMQLGVPDLLSARDLTWGEFNLQ